ncbi:hypothetical protein BB559_004407 [Furculomyces boomerangus]|uniref:t-SNARE coiled-coil homology domain-containing protein n=1 Tax=Furculomyces boomerangus TaxID=61424 RepID=A0A2T9Y1K9_9FUNG|nr:hypothetical protein BB559_006603 [Furculomyces boomerangus]PVU90876.1 hypothetical protein BB559_004407 [Furculomyces boomerangus]
MQPEEVYLDRFLYRFEKQSKHLDDEIQKYKDEPKTISNEKIEEMEKAIKNFDCLKALYEQVKINYAENEEEWQDEYKSRIQKLVKWTMKIQDNILNGRDESSKKENDSSVTDKDLPQNINLETKTSNVVNQNENLIPKDNILILEPLKSEKHTRIKEKNIESVNKSKKPKIPEYLIIRGKQDADERRELLGKHLQKQAEIPDSENVGDTEKIINMQKRTQEELADELLGMARVLKNNTLLFGDTIKKDADTINEAGEIIEKNYEKIKKEGNRLNIYRSKAWKTTGLTWIAIAFVFASFAFLVMIMKVVPKVKY